MFSLTVQFSSPLKYLKDNINVAVSRIQITRSTVLYQVLLGMKVWLSAQFSILLYCKLVDVNVHSTDKIDVTTR